MSAIGALIVEATKQAKPTRRNARPNGYTAKAECGCQVHVCYFSANSHTLRITRCPDHPKENGHV